MVIKLTFDMPAGDPNRAHVGVCPEHRADLLSAIGMAFNAAMRIVTPGTYTYDIEWEPGESNLTVEGIGIDDTNARTESVSGEDWRDALRQVARWAAEGGEELVVPVVVPSPDRGPESNIRNN